VSLDADPDATDDQRSRWRDERDGSHEGGISDGRAFYGNSYLKWAFQPPC